MPPQCATCETTIEDSAVRYERTGGDGTEVFCSLNCLAGTERFDESAVRETLFDEERLLRTD